MSQQTRWTQRFLGGLRRRLPSSVRQALGRVRRWFVRPPVPALPVAAHDGGRPTTPVLSVVIPVFNVAPYLEECLESVRRQTLTRLEVLLVDDGSTDGSREIMERYVRRDDRFILLEQPNQGQAVARNLAVRKARGEFLTFVDGDDVVPRSAFAAMVKSLRTSGSDLVVGAALRLRNGRLSAPIWNATVHRRDRRGLTIDDFPGAMWDVIACNRMFRRVFWIEKVGGFRAGVAYEDHVPMVTAYVRARSFDLLARTVYHWRYRENLSSDSQQKHELGNLQDRLSVKAEAAAMLSVEASPAVRAAWLGRVLDTDLASYIDFALIADDDYRATMRAAFEYYLSQADESSLRHIRVLQKIRGQLVAESRWDDLVAVQRWFREIGGMPATRVVGGRVSILPVDGPLARLDLPAEVLELAWHETDLRACLATAVWLDHETLEVSGWAFIANVDLSDETPSLSIRLVGRQTGQLVAVDLEPVSTPAATRWSAQRQARVDRAGFRARVDAGALASYGPEFWQLEITVRTHGIDRQGPVFDAIAGSSAAGALLTASRPTGTDVIVLPRFDATWGFVLDTSQLIAELETPPALVDGAMIGSIKAVGGHDLPASLVLVRQPGKKRLPISWLDDGTSTSRQFSIGLVPPDLPTPGRWELRRSPGKSVAEGVAWPQAASGQLELATLGPAGTQAVWRGSARGSAVLQVGGPRLMALDVLADDCELVIVVAGPDSSAKELTGVELTSADATVPLSAVDRDDAACRWRFPSSCSRFGLTATPLPSGTYQVTFRDQHGARQLVPAGTDLRGMLTRDWLGPHHRIRLSASANALQITLGARLDEDELGRWAGAAQLRRYRALQPTPEPSVLFQSWDGSVASGDQLALHHALGAMRPGLLRYWAVTDESVVLPADAVPLLIGSRAYWDVLAKTCFLSSNVDLGERFTKRPYQRFLQTCHGHPFAAVGRRFWEGRRGYPEAWIQAECTRLNQQWDVLLAPNQLAAELYRSEYDYLGDVLTLGSPRCDDLVQNDPARRSAVRDAMGIGDHDLVTLYAPTSRDLLTTRGSAKRRFAELNLDDVASHLGSGHHLWVRGHHDNKRVPERVSGIRGVRDVTDYPDVNDLILAADLLLTDYSAIRFDWAVTGKPMVFFTPDEQSYLRARPALFDLAESRPGPIARTTSEVIDQLAHPAELAERWAAAITAFNRRFNQLQDGGAAARVVDAFFTP